MKDEKEKYWCVGGARCPAYFDLQTGEYNSEKVRNLESFQFARAIARSKNLYVHPWIPGGSEHCGDPVDAPSGTRMFVMHGGFLWKLRKLPNGKWKVVLRTKDLQVSEFKRQTGRNPYSRMPLGLAAYYYRIGRDDTARKAVSRVPHGSSWLSKIENGNSDDIFLSSFYTLAEAVDVLPDRLLMFRRLPALRIIETGQEDEIKREKRDSYSNQPTEEIPP